MFKFKMSLLLKNVKFRVAVAVIAVAAIVAGIAFIPKNKAALPANPVNVKANPIGVTVGGKSIYAIEKDGNAQGYNNLFCVEEDAHLSYKTYSNPVDITKANGYFSNYNSAVWLINNMYVSNTAGGENAKSVLAMHLANLVTSDSVKAEVKKLGFDGSNVTPDKIYNLRNKVLGNSFKKNALEVIEQIALWKYTNNAGTTVSNAYRSNPNTFLTGANLTDDEQRTLKYTYYALTVLADKNAGTPASKSVSNQVKLNTSEAKFDENTFKVGPYSLESNGVRLTSYKFGDAGFSISETITNNDGTTATAGAELVEKSADGKFYINLNSFKNANKLTVTIGNLLNGINTEAYVVDGGDKQNIMNIDKSVSVGSLSDTKEIKVTVPEGTFSINLKKVKEDGATLVTEAPATFKVNGAEKNTTNGVLTIESARKIENVDQVVSYEIVETKAPAGYIGFKGTMKINVAFKQVDKTFVIDRDKTTTEGFANGAKVEFSADSKNITVVVPNKKQEFDLALRKFITKVDDVKVEPSREPVVNVQSIKDLQATGTASYFHTKDSITVNVGSVVEYTIRVYNEDKTLGFARQITDYIPDGLRFIKIADESAKEYTTTSKEGDKVVVLNYTGDREIKSLRDFIGAQDVKLSNDYYQEVKIICVVEKTDLKYITSRAEITNYGFYDRSTETRASEWKDARTVGNVDKDSAQNTIRNDLGLNTWYETHVNENDGVNHTTKYYPGVQDDDDFETVEVVTGKYNIIIKKVDSKNTNTTLPGAYFSVKGTKLEEKEVGPTAVNGEVAVIKGVEIANGNQVDEYTIKETKAPVSYHKYDGEIKVKVGAKTNGKSYVIDENATTVNGENVKSSISADNTTITIVVPNVKKEFDLSLRKFITKVGGEKINPSREPVINVQSIKDLQETGTASYFHNKTSVGITVGAEVEYTLRVYNEGEIEGYAKQITDYIPEGLRFVRIADESAKEYTTTSKEGDKAIVLNYTGNKKIKSLRDFFGANEVKVTSDYYQEVKVVCVTEKVDKTYLTNRAEITNYGYEVTDENGNVEWKDATEIGNVDRDSVQNTIKDDLGLDDWYEKHVDSSDSKSNTDGKSNSDSKSNNDKYYPGVQDDDDFETLELLTGKYNIIIKKVDSKDRKTTLPGAYFSVKGSKVEETEVGPTAANGEVTVLKGIEIASENQADEYTIKETKAPVNYHTYNGDIKVKIATKNNGKVFVIDEKSTTVNGKDVEFFTNKENTTITIVVPDVKKEFDLSLRKFITEINGEKLKDSREPKVDTSKLASGESTTATYKHPKNTLDVNTTDIVTYTLRIYNEGELDGFAKKVMDDIPEGLEFLPENEVNKEYKWVMYKEVNAKGANTIEYDGKNYEVTKKASEADVIVTEYLKNSLINAFDAESKKLDYKDVKVAFKVTEPTTSDRVLTNYAQIIENADSKGNPIADRDSTPNKWNDGEDDQDIESVKVRYFDLALRKWVTKAIVNENGVEKVTETNHDAWDDPEPVVKVDLLNTNIDNVTVKFEYSIRVINQGEIEGYAKEVSDYIPEGLKFVAEDNKEWKEVDGKIVTRQLENTLLKPGEYVDITVVLTWINGANNLGLKTNIAEISEDYNEWETPDIDSTPNNKVPGEDDIDDAPVILAVRTGTPIVYTGVAVAAIAIVSLGVVVIRTKVLA